MHHRNPDLAHQSPIEACTVAADCLLDQAARFIAGIDESTYTRPCPLASGGTIGRHLRHCLDHYTAAIDGAVAGPIDYDHRERAVPMENHPGAAIEAIDRLRRQLTQIGRGGSDSVVTVRVMVGNDGRTVDLASTLARELAFAAHHALHHHAMIKFIADSFGFATPEDFGKAPSTVHHERGIAAPTRH